MTTHADTLARTANPLDWTSEQRELFVAACRELAVHNQQCSAEIAYIYREACFDPTTIRQESDIARLPWIGVSAMKHFLLLTADEREATLKLTSSGTQGQKTQIWFDASSLARVQAMLDGLWLQEGLVSREPTSYLFFVYDPDQAKDLGIAFSYKNLQRFAPTSETVYAIRKDERGEWAFSASAIAEKLRAMAAQKRPVRLAGMPGFIHELLVHLDGTTIPLPHGSFLLTGGGWKAAEARKVSREEFRRRVVATLAIPEENIRDGYGMAEHSAPYIECREHRLHVPVFCRVIVRDPTTLAPLSDGEVGLLELVSPYNTMMPNLAILSTDLGAIDPRPCSCGRAAPTFTVVGRAGLRQHKGCALAADDIVQRA